LIRTKNTAARWRRRGPRSRRWHRIERITIFIAAWLAAPVVHAQTWTFTDVTAEAGVAFRHDYPGTAFSLAGLYGGGVAAGDYDGDGWVDLYAVRGTVGPNLLFHNQGDGTFAEVATTAGVALARPFSVGPAFADFDGDGWLDLLVLGVDGAAPVLFRNRGDGSFEDVTATSGLRVTRDTYSAAFGDFDRDGDLDLVLGHWLAAGDTEVFWRNNGDGTFTDITAEVGVAGPAGPSWVFTPNFADINNDGWPDLLMAADFGTSRVLLNEGGARFRNMTSPVISDENGMGAAVGDYDNDGDLDWFVSSIWDPDGVAEGNWGVSGNRLYNNRGNGTFVDVTDAAGVRVGYWGWASTFGDFNNDGWLDLFHVNGYAPADLVPEASVFAADPARLFVGTPGGRFDEESRQLGVDNVGLGRGALAFDYDRDGDLDLFIQNNLGEAHLLRNDGGNRNSFLTIKLRGQAPNSEGIGARVLVSASGATQLRELRAGSNFESQDPAEAHFGLANAAAADAVSIMWPDGRRTGMVNVRANQFLVVTQTGGSGADCAASPPDNRCRPGPAVRPSACWLEWRVAPARAGALAGSGPIGCTEGDVACDTDPDLRNHSCTLRAALCINNTDPRLPACLPSDVTRVEVRLPRRRMGDGVDGTTRSLLERAAGGGAGGFAVRVGSAARWVFSNPTPNLCTTPLDLVVPMRPLGGGVFGAGRKVVRVRTTNSQGQRDSDSLKLECRPRPGGSE
jgi:hypothetical protein